MHTHRQVNAVTNSAFPTFRLSLIAASLFALSAPSYAADEAVDTITVTAQALKVATPLAEEGRSVTVIDEQQLKVQQPTQLDEALRYQPGVMTQPYGSDNDTNWFKVRGFDAATYLDNNRLFENGYYVWTLEPYGLEQVEVLKGPAAILYGEAPPGGVINAVSKRPHYEEGGEVEVKLGNRNLRQVGIDVTSFADDDGDVRFRLVGMVNERDGMLDGTDNQRYYFAPSLAWDISPDTTLTFLASIKHDEGVPVNPFKPVSGTLLDDPLGKLDASTNLGNPDYDRNRNTQYSVGYILEHQFNDTWSFKQNTRYAHTDLLLRSTYISSTPATAGILGRSIIYRDGTTDNISTDNQFVANWQTADTENVTLFGVDLARFQNDSMGNGFGSATTDVDIFNPDNSGFIPVDTSTLAREKVTKSQVGVYAQQQVKLYDRLIAKLGGRYDMVRVETPTAASQDERDIHSDNFALSGGLMYLTDFGLSPYVSYAESFEVIASVDTNTGNVYKPLKGEQIEAGFKYEPSFINGYFNLAWFDITQKNGLVSTSTGVQTQAGELTSQGVEFDAVAHLTKALLMRANYTYTDAKTDNVIGQNPVRSALIPRHMASGWFEYDFSHAGIEGFVLGAGSRYVGTSVGANSWGATPDIVKVPSVVLFDAMARYDINSQWRAQLNVNNIGDKTYVASCDYYCYYGEEMTATATLNYRW